MSKILMPKSCVDNRVALASIMAAIIVIAIYKYLGFGDPYALLTLVCATIFIFNIAFDENYKFRSTLQELRIKFKSAYRFNAMGEAARRLAYKAVAFYGLIAAAALVYFLATGFSNQFVVPHVDFIIELWPWLFVLSCVYLALTDIWLDEKEDELYRIGRFILFKSSLEDVWRDKTYLLACVIKLFFAPLMISFAYENVTWILSDNYLEASTLFDYCDVFFRAIYTVDVVFATIGYLSAMKLWRTEIRSVDPKPWGWFVCLMFYPPLWPHIRESFFEYDRGFGWQDWLFYSESLVYVWSAILISLMTIYGWSTASFGIRFSNLTNRGIITNGPYRWFKHPAYLSKNISWWMMSVPFVIQDDLSGAIRSCVLLSIVNGLYYLRARAEEIQLREDPAYRDYEAFITNYGAIGTIKTYLRSFLARRLPSNP